MSVFGLMTHSLQLIVMTFAIPEPSSLYWRGTEERSKAVTMQDNNEPLFTSSLRLDIVGHM